MSIILINTGFRVDEMTRRGFRIRNGEDGLASKEEILEAIYVMVDEWFNELKREHTIHDAETLADIWPK